MSERLDERLRRAARTYRRLGNHTAEGMFLEAADTICELQTENAKLRDELDFCLKFAPNCDECEAMLDCDECLRADGSHKERGRLSAENFKLRELCADMWHVMWACAEQRCKHRENECYVVNGNNGALPSHDECWYKRRMRELGVEL